MGHEEETPRLPMNLRICGVPAETTLPFVLTHLTETSKRTELFGNIHPDVVVKQDERRLLRLSFLATWHPT